MLLPTPNTLPIMYAYARFRPDIGNAVKDPGLTIFGMKRPTEALCKCLKTK